MQRCAKSSLHVRVIMLMAAFATEQQIPVASGLAMPKVIDIAKSKRKVRTVGVWMRRLFHAIELTFHGTDVYDKLLIGGRSFEQWKQVVIDDERRYRIDSEHLRNLRCVDFSETKYPRIFQSKVQLLAIDVDLAVRKEHHVCA